MTNLEALMKFPSGFAGYVRTAKMVCHTLSILSLLDPFGSSGLLNQYTHRTEETVSGAVLCLWSFLRSFAFIIWTVMHGEQPLRQMRQWPGIFPTSYCLLLSCLKLRHIAMGSGGMIRDTM